MTFTIGQKVVCVDARDTRRGHSLPLKRGQILTICSIISTWDGIGLEFNEIVTPVLDGHVQAFNSRRFRPVVDRKTDISIFTEILHTTKAPSIAERIGLGDLVGSIAQPARTLESYNG
jgi:hypothetical protein